MDKIGWIGLLLNTFHLGNQSVGKQPSMNEYARETINASGLGTFAMTEGYTLIATILILVVGTLVLNGCANLFVRIM